MTFQGRRLRSIEAEGFFHGVHLVSREPVEHQVSAQFDQAAYQIAHDTVDSVKNLEAQETVLAVRRRDAEQLWRRLEAETGGMAPEVAMPLIATAGATLAVLGETLLLAPVMDGFGISDPNWQIVSATTFVVVGSGLLHLALLRIHEAMNLDETGKTADRRTHWGTLVTTLLSAFALATVTTLGWWRAGEMIFAADAMHGEWSQFLHQNELLTKTCLSLLTLALPFFTASSYEWGIARTRYALLWRRARKSHQRLLQQLETVRKGLQAVVEKRDRQMQMVEQQKQAWLQSYRENYQMGEHIGAQRPAAWRVVLHIGAVTLLIAAFCAVADVWLQRLMTTDGRMWLYGCMTSGLGGLYAHLAVKAWVRPTPQQLYRQRAVVWRDPKRAVNQ